MPFPSKLASDLNSGLCVYDDNCAVGDSETLIDFAFEIKIAGVSTMLIFTSFHIMLAHAAFSESPV